MNMFYPYTYFFVSFKDAALNKQAKSDVVVPLSASSVQAATAPSVRIYQARLYVCVLLSHVDFIFTHYSFVVHNISYVTGL